MSGSTGLRRYLVDGIRPGRRLLISGRIHLDADGETLRFAADPGCPLFLISTRDERTIAARYRWQHLGALAAGLAVAGIGNGLLAADAAGDPGHGVLVGAIAAGAVALVWAAGWVWLARNGVIALAHRIAQAQGNLDVELQRRRDLIPALRDLAAGIMGWEAEVQAMAAAMRGGRRAGPLLDALVEAHPGLAAAPGMAELQRELIRCDDRIARARAYLGELSSHLADRLQRVPEGWICRLLTRLRPAGGDDAPAAGN